MEEIAKNWMKFFYNRTNWKINLELISIESRLISWFFKVYRLVAGVIQQLGSTGWRTKTNKWEDLEEPVEDTGSPGKKANRKATEEGGKETRHN